MDKLPAHSVRHPVLLLALLLVIDSFIIHIYWRDLNDDLSDHVLPWYRFILEHGWLSAWGMRFSNYTPPYLYLLSVGTLADRLLDPASIIRGISVSFNALGALGVLWFARAYGWSRENAFYIAVAFFALPEIVVNGLIWGQSDIIYTLLVAAFVCLVIARKGTIAMAAIGLAFAFKLQAVFIGPFLLYLYVVRALSLRQFLIAPLIYLVTMAPAAAAGRGWVDLLSVYARQITEYRQLSLNAPNPYVIVQYMLPISFDDVVVRVGLVIAAVVALVLVVAFVARGREPARETLLFMATLNLAVVPYVLPEMHERYFFPASVMAFLLAVARARTWPVVVLIQAADLLAYTRFLLNFRLLWVAIGVTLMTCAIAALIWLFLRVPVESQSSSALETGR